MSSRSIDDLSAGFRAQAVLLKDAAEAVGLDLIIYCTRRSFAEQAKLYRNGRTLAQIQDKADELCEQWGRADLATILMDVAPQFGKRILTYAAPGQSYHNYGLALDAVPLREGRPVWGDTEPDDLALWNLYGELAGDVNMEWGGSWSPGKIDRPHMQQKNINWRNLIEDWR
ncbi:MAG: hypothetical protein COB22_07850 [Cycloclasticus sp.]|nr:MAG: hypothetical protein COB22_07850 [Cycloclasticus sp.]